LLLALSWRNPSQARNLPLAVMDYLKIHSISASAVEQEADNLYSNWPQLPAENKRRVIEGIVDR
jgi:hypothetical protein